MTDPDSVLRVDTAEETDMAKARRQMTKRVHKTRPTGKMGKAVRTLSRGRKTLKRAALLLELLAGVLLVGLEIRDQMRDRELDSEAVKVLAEARSLPQTALRAIKGAATQGAGTKKRTTDTRI